MSLQPPRIAVIGAGVVGQCSALALSKLGLSVHLFDSLPAPQLKAGDLIDPQVFALNRSALELLQYLDVDIDQQPETCCYFNKIELWCHNQSALLEHIELPNLGQLIENKRLKYLLYKALESSLVQCYFDSQCELLSNNGAIELVFEAKKHHYDLIVIADGAGSLNRYNLAVALHRQPTETEQVAVCTSAVFEKDLQTALYQKFSTEGTIALLSMQQRQRGSGSIIWAVQSERAQQLRALDSKELSVEIATALDYKFGAINTVQPIATFPLQRQMVQHITYQNALFIGDSMQTVHPLAGLGLNLGLSEVRALFEVLQMSDKRFSTTKVLGNYRIKVAAHAVFLQQLLELINNCTLKKPQALALAFKALNHSKVLQKKLLQQACNF